MAAIIAADRKGRAPVLLQWITIVVLLTLLLLAAAIIVATWSWF